MTDEEREQLAALQRLAGCVAARRYLRVCRSTFDALALGWRHAKPATVRRVREELGAGAWPGRGGDA